MQPNVGAATMITRTNSATRLACTQGLALVLSTQIPPLHSQAQTCAGVYAMASAPDQPSTTPNYNTTATPASLRARRNKLVAQRYWGNHKPNPECKGAALPRNLTPSTGPRPQISRRQGLLCNPQHSTAATTRVYAGAQVPCPPIRT